MAKNTKSRNGFYVMVDNKIGKLETLSDAAYYISSAEANRAAKELRDIMIGDIYKKSYKSLEGYGKVREEQGVTSNVFHKDTGGDYDSVTKGLVTFPNKALNATGQYTVGVGASRGRHSVQNAGMPASIALALVDKGFNAGGAINFPLTNGREKIAESWSVYSVRPKNFTDVGVAAGNRKMREISSSATFFLNKQFKSKYGAGEATIRAISESARNYYIATNDELEDGGEE